MGKRKKKTKKYTTARNRKYNLLNFKINDTFFWDITKFEHLILNIFDFNELKLEEDEITFLKNLIKELQTKQIVNKKGLIKEIEILPVFKEIFDTFRKFDTSKIKYVKDIEKIINDFPKDYTFHLKDIQKKLHKKKKIKLSKTKIFHLLKAHTKYRYLKTTIKNSILDENKSIIMTFIFLKTFVRAIKMGIKPLYIDESGFMIINNNYRRWRIPKSDLNIGPKKNSKVKTNLLICVSDKKITYKKLTSSNADEKVFSNFVKKIIEIIPSEEIKNYLVIMDNASFHKTSNVIELFLKNKLKVLTCTPYYSKLNMAEYIFRHIKNKTYKNSYTQLKDLDIEIMKILESEKIENVIPNLYKYTLKNYMDFIEKYNEKIDLNKAYDDLDINDESIFEEEN